MSMPSYPKIQDPAHAVRVIKHFIKHGSKRLNSVYSKYENGEWDNKPTWEYTFLLSWVEGAKLILEEYMKESTPMPGPGENEVILVSNLWFQNLIVKIAKTYAPRMIEAGMEVPK